MHSLLYMLPFVYCVCVSFCDACCRGLGVAVAPDTPCVHRVVFNSVLDSAFAVCDIGLSPLQANGGAATIHFIAFNVRSASFSALSFACCFTLCQLCCNHIISYG